jgi:ribonuclease J
MATSEARLRISPLGGVGEVGKNSTLIEFGDDLVIVDAGVKFPEAELHGVDLVVPDYGYVGERLDLLLGILFTHGHEDHIGGLPYLIMQLDPHDPIPIYGTPLTLGLITVKLKEHGMLGRVVQHPISDGQRRSLGPSKSSRSPSTTASRTRSAWSSAARSARSSIPATSSSIPPQSKARPRTISACASSARKACWC